MSRKAILGTVLLVALAACSRGSKGLSVSTRLTSPKPAAAALVLDDGVTIERIRLAVREVSVERDDDDARDGGACQDDSGPGDHSGPGGGEGDLSMTPPASPAHEGGDDGDDGEDDDACEGEELEFGPFFVELEGAALTGPVSFAFDVPVPEGTFEEVEIKIHTVPAQKAGDDAGLLAMAEAHASIIVEGVLDAGTPGAKPFTFATPMEVTQKREGPISIGGDPPANVTLDFDPSGWFTAPGGGRLDPTDPVNQGQILENIRASIRILRDDDVDGCDDDHGEGCQGDDD